MFLVVQLFVFSKGYGIPATICLKGFSQPLRKSPESVAIEGKSLYRLN